MRKLASARVQGDEDGTERGRALPGAADTLAELAVQLAIYQSV